MVDPIYACYVNQRYVLCRATSVYHSPPIYDIMRLNAYIDLLVGAKCTQTTKPKQWPVLVLHLYMAYAHLGMTDVLRTVLAMHCKQHFARLSMFEHRLLIL